MGRSLHQSLMLEASKERKCRQDNFYNCLHQISSDGKSVLVKEIKKLAMLTVKNKILYTKIPNSHRDKRSFFFPAHNASQSTLTRFLCGFDCNSKKCHISEILFLARKISIKCSKKTAIFTFRVEFMFTH